MILEIGASQGTLGFECQQWLYKSIQEGDKLLAFQSRAVLSMWQILMKIKEIQDAELAASAADIENIKWEDKRLIYTPLLHVILEHIQLTLATFFDLQLSMIDIGWYSDLVGQLLYTLGQLYTKRGELKRSTLQERMDQCVTDQVMKRSQQML